MSSKAGKWGTLFPALVLLAAAGYVISQILFVFIPDGVHTGKGERNPALFPALVASILFLLAVINLIKTVLINLRENGDTAERAAQEKEEEENGYETGETRTGLLRLSWGVFLFLVLYCLTLDFLGFHLSTFLVLAASLFLLGCRHPLKLLVFSVGITFLAWFCFSELLNLILPVGFWV